MKYFLSFMKYSRGLDYDKWLVTDFLLLLVPRIYYQMNISISPLFSKITFSEAKLLIYARDVNFKNAPCVTIRCVQWISASHLDYLLVQFSVEQTSFWSSPLMSGKFTYIAGLKSVGIISVVAVCKLKRGCAGYEGLFLHPGDVVALEE